MVCFVKCVVREISTRDIGARRTISDRTSRIFKALFCLELEPFNCYQPFYYYLNSSLYLVCTNKALFMIYL